MSARTIHLIIRTIVRSIFWTAYATVIVYFFILCWERDLPGAICTFALVCAPAVPMKIIEYQDQREAKRRGLGRHVRLRHQAPTPQHELTRRPVAS